MKRALIVVFLLLLAVVASIVTRLNNEAVHFDFYFSSIELPLSLLLLFAICGGALFGLLLTLGIAISARADKRRLQRNLRLREQEIRNLRQIPIKGRH